jgi:hypothetical protein
MQPMVFIDLETRSACDLRREGGARYAADSTTRLLTVAWTDDWGESYHVWFPGAAEDALEKPGVGPGIATHLPGVTVHWKGDGSVPEALRAVTDRPWVGHNAWTFDRHVWRGRGGPEPVRWEDTYPLALAAGLPGGLDKIGRQLWGTGKYEPGNAATKAASRATRVPGDSEPDNIPPVQQIMVARYNVQDVRLTVELRKVIDRELKLTDHERRVLGCHDSCNARGVAIDREFVRALIRLSDEAKGRAVTKVAALTAGHKHALANEADLRSRTKVFAWLGEMGVKIGDSLARAVVAKYIEDNRKGTEDDEKGETDEAETDDPGEPETDDPAGVSRKAVTKNLPLVVKVLELRMQALRVTEGKLKAALSRADEDGRIRYWAAYWAAHTGRWAGRGLQPHNLPRPKEGVDIWGILGHYERSRTDPTVAFDYDSVEALLPIGARGADGKLLYPYLSVDDAAGGLLRSIIVPDAGKVLAAADLANIEARVLAWLAGEKWLMEAFWAGADPYTAMAGKIFGPSDRWPAFPDPKTGKPLPLKKHPFRQVGKVVVLGSGYQLGVEKFAVYAASNGIDLDAVGTTPRDCIIEYRRMHPAIAGRENEFEGNTYFRGGYWDNLNSAAIAAVQSGGPVTVGPVTFVMRGGHLRVVLPSGRELTYRDARAAEAQFHKRTIQQVRYTSPRFGPTPMYGGKWAENIVQAVSRDVLAHGFVALEDAGLFVVLHVHDELASPIDPDPEVMDVFMRCVTTPPAWLTNFPLDAEGSFASRYAKSPPPEWKAKYGDEWLYRNGKRHK